MSAIARNEKHGTRRNRLYVCERVKIHEFDVTAKRRMRGELRRLAWRSAFTSRSAVEVIKLTLNGARVLIQFMDGPAGVFGLAAINSIYRCSAASSMIFFLCSRVRARLSPLRFAAPISTHAHCRDGFHPRVNFRTDNKAFRCRKSQAHQSAPDQQMVWCPGNLPQHCKSSA